MNNPLIDWALQRARGEDVQQPKSTLTEMKCAHSDLSALAQAKVEQFQRLQAELSMLNASLPFLVRAIETASQAPPDETKAE